MQRTIRDQRPDLFSLSSCNASNAIRKVFYPAALASISSDEAESFDSEEHASKAEDRRARTVPEGVARHLSGPNPQGPASAPPALRPAMSDPLEHHTSMGLRRRKSARISDADAATAAAALAGVLLCGDSSADKH